MYACTSYTSICSLWDELATILGGLIFHGDFKVVLGAHEYREKGLPLKITSDEFRGWSDSNLSTHLQIKGVQFTWNNGRRGNNLIEKRLDRLICKDVWLEFRSDVAYCIFPSNDSDQYSILLQVKKEVISFASFI